MDCILIICLAIIIILIIISFLLYYELNKLRNSYNWNLINLNCKLESYKIQQNILEEKYNITQRELYLLKDLEHLNMNEKVKNDNKKMDFKLQNVLVGSSNSKTLKQLRDKLLALGFSVDTVSLGKEVSKKVAYGKTYDVIITSASYEDNYNSTKILKELRNKYNCNTPIVLLLSPSANEQEYLDSGFSCCIKEDVSEKDLLNVMKSLLIIN